MTTASISVKKILVPIDFSKISLHALDYAATIAKYADAEIVLLHVFETYSHNTMLQMTVDFTDIIEKGINDKLSEIREMNPNLLGIPIHSRVVTGKIHREIEMMARVENAKLIVMGTHGVSGITNIDKFIIGSNAYKAMQSVPCPIVTLRDRVRHKPISDIVLPIDSTKESDEKLEIAIRWAKFFDASIHILAVTALMEELVVDVQDINKKVKKVELRCKEAGVKYTAYIHRHQAPSESVLEHARRVDADLIIIVTGQESQLTELLFGSSARTIISESPIPVLSINIRNQD